MQQRHGRRKKKQEHLEQRRPNLQLAEPNRRRDLLPALQHRGAPCSRRPPGPGVHQKPDEGAVAAGLLPQGQVDELVRRSEGRRVAPGAIEDLQPRLRNGAGRGGQLTVALFSCLSARCLDAQPVLVCSLCGRLARRSLPRRRERGRERELVLVCATM